MYQNYRNSVKLKRGKNGNEDGELRHKKSVNDFMKFELYSQHSKVFRPKS